MELQQHWNTIYQTKADTDVSWFEIEPGVSVRVGGQLIIVTFALDGPEQCSGLEICRYDSAGLCNELGPQFQLLQEQPYVHVTPAGKEQQFIFCIFRRVLRFEPPTI
jgi:hypothetical protein